MTPQEHIAAALNFQQLADTPIAQQNPLLRSELLWCAAAHAVKAAAKQHGWENQTHADLFQTISRLARNPIHRRFPQWFNQASRLHRNMYEGNLSDRAITESRNQVHQLVNRLTELAE